MLPCLFLIVVGFTNNPNGLIPAVLLERKKSKAKSKNNHKMNRYSMSFPFVFLLKACALFVSEWAVCFRTVPCSGLSVAFTVVKILYMRMKAQQKTCLKKKIDELLSMILLKSTVALLTQHFTSSRLLVKRITTGQRLLPSSGGWLILDNIHIRFSVQCNCFFLFFPTCTELVSENVQNEIEKNNTHAINLL